jgi:hypothetical protein
VAYWLVPALSGSGPTNPSRRRSVFGSSGIRAGVWAATDRSTLDRPGVCCCCCVGPEEPRGCARYACGDLRGGRPAEGKHPEISPGAHPDRGEVTWSVSGNTITIEGVTIGDDNQPVTITVPLSGHERTNNASVFSPPVGFLPGRTEVQVTG